MATIIHACGGSTVNLLASLTSVPTTATAVSGAEKWKEYDAIYFECFINDANTSDKAVFTNLILTNNVSIGDKYQPIRVSGSDGSSNQVNIYCNFSENVISINKTIEGYSVTKLNIYGVDF